MSLVMSIQTPPEKKQKRRRLGTEESLFDFLIFFVIIGLPATLVFLTWKFWS